MLTFCGLTNGPSKSPFNCFCFKCLTQLWAVLWRKPVHSRSRMRKFRYATEMQLKPVMAEKHSKRVLWWLFGYVHLQVCKQRWHLEFKTLRVTRLLGYPSKYISWCLHMSSSVWNYSDPYFQAVLWDNKRNFHLFNYTSVDTSKLTVMFTTVIVVSWIKINHSSWCSTTNKSTIFTRCYKVRNTKKIIIRYAIST